MVDDIPYYLGFSQFLGIGPVRFSALVKHFGTVKKAYEGNVDGIKKIIGANLAEKFAHFRCEFDPDKKLDELKKKNIIVLTQEHKSFPAQLQNISDPPICLYIKGNLNNFNFVKDYFIAIVGTRKPTAYGEQITKKFAEDLAVAGFVTVSGMAMGIDAIAHWGALNVAGKTIAFLGCGVDVVYPPVNYRLYQEIINKKGLIVSEFPPGRTVLPGLFIARNRLISGLSRGVLVIEGAKDSGALITARYAAEQGKEVFAPPSPLTSEMSAAPNILLKQGARFVTTVDDIIEEFGLKIIPKKKEEITLQLDNDEKLIFSAIENEPKLTDEIVSAVQLPINKVLNMLSILEIKGIIEKNKEGRYQIKLT